MPVYDAQYDLNNDGIIDQRDMDILTGLIAGTIFNPALEKQADFNGDGKLSALDITRLSQHIGAVRPFKINAMSAIPLAAGILLAGLGAWLAKRR